MERFSFLFIVFIYFLSTLFSYGYPQTSPRTGIAFVHGTNDHSDNAIGGYWKSTFISEIANAMPKPDWVYVVHCDYSDYMWNEAAAGCTVDQLLNFISVQQLDKLVLYTHSDGANVVRWILSNPTYDPRYMKLFPHVKEVIAVAPSSGGTPLADEVLSGGLFEEGVGWLLGYRNNAVKQQRVGEMARYNQEILMGGEGQPALAVPFKVVVGSSVAASPLSSASYCNGYFLNTALKVTKIYLDYCADGFLDCRSQEAAGEVWFYDREQMDNGNTLSHNQSRHTCFGMDRLLLNHLAAEGVLG